METGYCEGLFMLAVDEAGPLWRLMEDFFESLPVKPKWILLGLLIVALMVVVVASFKRRQ